MSLPDLKYIGKVDYYMAKQNINSNKKSKKSIAGIIIIVIILLLLLQQDYCIFDLGICLVSMQILVSVNLRTH